MDDRFRSTAPCTSCFHFAAFPTRAGRAALTKSACPRGHLLRALLDAAPSTYECTTILGAIRRAGGEDSTLLIVEGVIRELRADPRSCTLDAVMLTVTGGRERSVDQLSKLFDRAGFELATVITTASPMRIVEARPRPQGARADTRLLTRV